MQNDITRRKLQGRGILVFYLLNIIDAQIYFEKDNDIFDN